MSSSTSASGRLTGFNAGVWVIGLLIALVMAIVMADDGAFEASGLVDADDEYRYSPWLRPEPLRATDLGGGRYEGADGAMIPLTGLDPAVPVVIRPGDGTYLSSVWVTGPDGEIVTAGEYDDPPEFRYLADESIVVLVAQPDVELWVNGPNDETWQAQVDVGGVPLADAEMVGFEPSSFLVDTGVSTARVTARGDGDMMIDVATVHGTEMVLSTETPVDQTIAWRDSPLVHIAVDVWGDAGWRIALPSADPAPSPPLSPAEAP